MVCPWRIKPNPLAISLVWYLATTLLPTGSITQTSFFLLYAGGKFIVEGENYKPEALNKLWKSSLTHTLGAVQAEVLPLLRWLIIGESGLTSSNNRACFWLFVNRGNKNIFPGCQNPPLLLMVPGGLHHWQLNLTWTFYFQIIFQFKKKKITL